MGKKKVAQQTGDTGVEEKAAATVAKTSAKQASKKIESGYVYIQASYNNTMMTVTDQSGNVLAWASAGALGFSGPKKATPFAAQKVAAVVLEKMQKTGPFQLKLVVRGVGSGRDSAIRTFSGAQGFSVVSIQDATPIPHNGPRPPKPRRV
jgi:small subunit ribosomal protein S11